MGFDTFDDGHTYVHLIWKLYLAQLVRGGAHVCDVAVYYPIEGIHASLLPSGHE